MARGFARQDIFLNEADRLKFIENLSSVAKPFDWVVWAWCLMDNHYHLLIQTRQPELSKGMREMNGVFNHVDHRALSPEIASFFGMRRFTASRIARRPG